MMYVIVYLLLFNFCQNPLFANEHYDLALSDNDIPLTQIVTQEGNPDIILQDHILKDTATEVLLPKFFDKKKLFISGGLCLISIMCKVPLAYALSGSENPDAAFYVLFGSGFGFDIGNFIYSTKD